MKRKAIKIPFPLPNQTKLDTVTAANVRNDGFHIFKGLRSAPAHWEAEKKVIDLI